MKKRILFIVILATIVGLVFYGNRNVFNNPSSAYAVGDLTVIWETDPLFNETNIVPGFTKTKTVNVANGASSIRPVGVRGILTSDPGNMKSVMNIKIKKGATTLYNNSLAQFFTNSGGPDGIFLSDLGPSANADYDFIVTFDSSAGNQFQNQTIVFNLQIGLSIELPEACDEIELLPNPIIGTAAAETLVGTPGNDLIMGLEGADKINGNSGDDCILGGTGADKINGNNGNDAIFGEEGADSINGNNGDDFIVGGAGADSLKGENGKDHLFGNEHADTLDGGNSDDLLEGGDAADNLRGGNGNDTLLGDLGTDSANGNNGIDTCDAESETNCEI